MKVLFVGAVRFSRVCLEAVAAAGGRVAAVMSPAPPKADGPASDREDLEPVARRLGLPFHRFGKIGDPEAVEFIRRQAPDVIVIFGLSQLLPPEVLGLPPGGCIGTHPALLPFGRGRHPLVWTLAEGLTESGLTFFYLDAGTDTGDILWQEKFRVEPEDDAGTLYGKIEEAARRAIPRWLPLLASGKAPRIPQDASKATVWRKRGEADGEIQWDGPAARAHNLVRALARPYLGAHTFWRRRRLTVWRSKPTAGRGAAGEVMRAGPGEIVVSAADGALALTEWSLEGGGLPAAGDRLGRDK